MHSLSQPVQCSGWCTLKGIAAIHILFTTVPDPGPYFVVLQIINDDLPYVLFVFNNLWLQTSSDHRPINMERWVQCKPDAATQSYF